MNDPELKEAIRKVWDLSSASYDNIPGHRIGTMNEKNAWKQELVRDLPHTFTRVLDIGCGTCVIGLLFAEMGYTVTGLDLSREMMVKARKTADDNGFPIDFQAGDAEHLPFRDNSFDIIVIRHLLWTLPDPDMALKEWFRALVPGGKILIIDGVWNDESLKTRAGIAISYRIARIFEPERLHPVSYSKAVRDLLPHGGGVPETTMLTYLWRAGFSDIHSRDLAYIRELQRSQLPWYRRIAQGRSYYIASAEKPKGINYQNLNQGN